MEEAKVGDLCLGTTSVRGGPMGLGPSVVDERRSCGVVTVLVHDKEREKGERENGDALT